MTGRQATGLIPIRAFMRASQPAPTRRSWGLTVAGQRRDQPDFAGLPVTRYSG